MSNNRGSDGSIESARARPLIEKCMSLAETSLADTKAEVTEWANLADHLRHRLRAEEISAIITVLTRDYQDGTRLAHKGVEIQARARDILAIMIQELWTQAQVQALTEDPQIVSARKEWLNPLISSMRESTTPGQKNALLNELQMRIENISTNSNLNNAIKVPALENLTYLRSVLQIQTQVQNLVCAAMIEDSEASKNKIELLEAPIESSSALEKRAIAEELNKQKNSLNIPEFEAIVTDPKLLEMSRRVNSDTTRKELSEIKQRIKSQAAISLSLISEKFKKQSLAEFFIIASLQTTSQARINELQRCLNEIQTLSSSQRKSIFHEISMKSSTVLTDARYTHISDTTKKEALADLKKLIIAELSKLENPLTIASHSTLFKVNTIPTTDEEAVAHWLNNNDITELADTDWKVNKFGKTYKISCMYTGENSDNSPGKAVETFIRARAALKKYLPDGAILAKVDDSASFSSYLTGPANYQTLIVTLNQKQYDNFRDSITKIPPPSPDAPS